MRLVAVVSVAASFALAGTCFAGGENFYTGPLIPEFGKIARVETTMPIPDGSAFSVAFDVSQQAEQGAESRYLASAARFLNMHVAAGVKPDDLRLAVVVHGGASKDLLSEKAYAARFKTDTANAALLRALMQHGVRVILCGQSAAYYDIALDDLEPGVEMALSAMTAHAQLQQSGYTLNPF
jgi:intracellular sulfur oxidation DsrE/DsrF family protein